MSSQPVPVTSSADLQGLARLRQRAANDDPAALDEAAVQFESLFIAMMLDSARSASLGSGILDGPQTAQYLDLMDQQVALEFARKGGFGLGKMLREQLAAHAAGSSTPARQERSAGLPQNPPVRLVAPVPGVVAPAVDSAPASGAAVQPAEPTQDFVARFFADAKKAAEALGVDPRLLLAQAALETGWGASTGGAVDGGSANNLFGIKAGPSWTGPRVTRWTSENEGGVVERTRAAFRAYPNASAGFADYAALIGGSPRYAAALAKAGNPEAYAHAVAAAGYATDPGYERKWLAIYRGDRLDSALNQLQSNEVGVSP